jgi:hypothetical protein
LIANEQGTSCLEPGSPREMQKQARSPAALLERTAPAVQVRAARAFMVGRRNEVARTSGATTSPQVGVSQGALDREPVKRCPAGRGAPRGIFDHGGHEGRPSGTGIAQGKYGALVAQLFSGRHVPTVRQIYDDVRVRPTICLSIARAVTTIPAFSEGIGQPISGTLLLLADALRGEDKAGLWRGPNLREGPWLSRRTPTGP